MSESRKRSRKSILEVRNENEYDETENIILQKFKKLSSPLLPKPVNMMMDHDYSRQSSSPAHSPIELSVKVEVEEFDESIMEADSDSNIIPIPVPGPSNSAEGITRKRKINPIQVFHIDVEKMYKISDHITWSSNNPADKYLSVELKNCWGRILKIEEREDPYNTLTQKALHAWGRSLINGRHSRATPLFYQCHICNLAWWYLQPFKDHIRTHDHKHLKVYHQENGLESIIVASNQCSLIIRYIECDGNCYRCGRPYETHIRTPDKPYIMCTKCLDTLGMCSDLKHHHPICINSKPIDMPKLFKCTICPAQYLTVKEFDSHMSMMHLVRSDLPCQFSIKICAACEQPMHNFNTHTCAKSSMNGTCTHCYRKFATKTLATFHIMMSDKGVKCPICDKVLPRKCMETEHMLTHTNKYKMAYKCINTQCSSTTLFPDEKSLKTHRALQHKLKFDRRRTYFELVLIPEVCVKLDSICDLDVAAACEELKLQEADIDADSSQIRKPDKRTDKEMLTVNVNIKREVEDVPEYSIPDESQDEEIDEYEQMLSKVFRVSEKVRKHQIKVRAEEQQVVQVKTEPIDEQDFEALIDIQDNPITIKKERIEIDGTCDIGEVIEICNIKTEPNDEQAQESERTDVSLTNICDERIRTAIKVEPEEQHLVEATDMKIMDTTTEQQNPTPTEIKLATKKKPYKVLIRLCPKTHTLKAEKYVNNTKKIDKKPQYIKSKVKGVRLRKVYRCAKCGYENEHKLYRVHKNSKCQRSPNVDQFKTYKCTKCEASFSTLKLYLVHFHKHGYESLCCPSCNVKFESFKDLMPHFHKHVRQGFVNIWMIDKKLNVTSKRQHKCQTCHQIVELNDFFAHWESHLIIKTAEIKLEPEVALEECDKETMSSDKVLKSPVLYSVLQQLRTQVRDRDCIVCFRKFSRRHDYKRHIIEHLLMDAYVKRSSTPDSGLRCQICLREFATAEKYRFHMREHGNLPVYKCELCDKTFSDSSNFAKHKKIHMLKVLICDICQKKFQAKFQLEKHILMHLESEPITCTICNAQFYTQSNYKKHVKIRHEHQKFKCVVCDMLFDSLRKKWDHAWKVHNERKNIADCLMCDEKFRKFQDLKSHSKAVHGVSMSFFSVKKSKGKPGKIKDVSVLRQIRPKEPKETLLVPSELLPS